MFGRSPQPFLTGTRVLCCLVLFVIGVFGVYSPPAEANVTRNFLLARKLFERKRYRQSERVLRRIIRLYPDHRASYFLLGRIAYRFGKSKKAAKFFRKSGSSFVTAESAFEYGITLFAIKKYSLAVKGLRRVSKRSSRKGVANFYAGVSYYHLRRWRQSERYLVRARRLPRTLESSRREFLREARRQIRIERAGAYRPQRPIYIPPPVQQQPQPYQQPYPSASGEPPPLPPGSGAPPPEKPEEKKTAEKKAPEKPAEPTYGYSHSTTPSIEYSLSTSSNEKHAFTTDESTEQGLTAGISSNIRYDTKSSTDYGLDLDVKVKDLNTTGATLKNIATEDDPTNIITQRNDTAPSKTRSLTFSGTPSASIPFGRDMTFKADFNLTMALPDMNFDEATQTRTPSGTLEFSLGDTSIDLSASLQQSVDAEGTTTDQLTTLKGGADHPFDAFSLNVTGTFSMVSDPKAATLGGFEQTLVLAATASKTYEIVSATFTGTITQKTPPSGQVVGGEQGSNDLGVSLSIPFDFGISLSGGANLTLIDQHITSVDEGEGDAATTVNVAASGQRQGFNATVKITPIDWAYFSGSLNRSETTFAVGNKEKQQDFQKATVDRKTSTSFAVGASTSF